MDEMDVIRLYKLGASRRDIAKSLKISDSKSAVNSHIPYTKSIYNSDSPTINAEKIRKSRKKKIAAKKPK